jgi:SAM-dependent methyltransferase
MWAGDRVFAPGAETAAAFVDPLHFAPDRVWYVPSSWFALRRALRGRELGPHEVFVDFGAGKGRALIAAARLPFTKVIGIEISPSLADAARLNVDAVRHRLRCQDIEVITADATEYPVPDAMTVAYLAHPFNGETFDRFVTALVDSLERRPRKVRVIYAVPECEAALLSTGRFERVRSIRIRDGNLPHRLSVYESLRDSSA